MADNNTHEDRKEEDTKNRIVDEIPEDLKRLTIFISKAFYGREHYVVMNYIQNLVCVKEDELRGLLKFDQRFLRGIIVQLKVDKLIKERIVTEECEGRSRKVTYYHINYRALLNVVKYKIDHMRQRLEVKDKDEVHKASYKCTGCQYHYDAMEMDKIFDPSTQEMRCWRCQQIVEPDETAGPTDETRSSLVRFNEQMAPLFAMIQNLDGIRLAPHLLEPPIKVTDNTQQGDEGERRVLQVGERAFSGHFATSRSTMYQNGITVNIEGENETQKVVDEKKAVPWLQSQIHSPTSTSTMDDQTQQAFADLVDNPLALAEQEPQEAHPVDSEVESLLLAEIEEAQKMEEAEAEKAKIKRAKQDLDGAGAGSGSGAKAEAPTGDKAHSSGMASGESDGDEDEEGDENRDDKDNAKDKDEEEDEEEDDDEKICVGGKMYYLDEINAQLVSKMTPEEKDNFIKVSRELYERQYKC